MEASYPGIKIFLCSRDELQYLFKNEPRTLNKTTLLSDRKQFAYIREIYFQFGKHPVEELMDESGIEIRPFSEDELPYGKAVLLTKGIAPTKSLSYQQIKATMEYVESKGMPLELNQDYDNFDWVIGVENENLYEAAVAGKKVTLIPTGNGENLFKRMFPKAEILQF